MQELLLPWKISLSVVSSHICMIMYVSISISRAPAPTSSPYNSHCLQGGKTEKIAFEMSRKLGAMAVRDVAPFPKP